MDGDQDAFAEIVYTFQDAVFNLCYRMLGERTEAEDATQEAFLRAYMNLKRYDHDRSFKNMGLIDCIQSLYRPPAKTAHDLSVYR